MTQKIIIIIIIFKNCCPPPFPSGCFKLTKGVHFEASGPGKCAWRGGERGEVGDLALQIPSGENVSWKKKRFFV